jgi:hypothetical protein
MNMTAGVYVWDKVRKEVVPVEERTDLPPSDAPYVIADTMDPLEHPCDGNMYDSKSQFEAVTRAHGCVCIGSEKLSEKPRRGIQLNKDLTHRITKHFIDSVRLHEQNKRNY